MTTGHGRVVWVDLTTPDLERAIHFYERLLGWHFDEHESDLGTYLSARLAGGDVGGMMAQQPEQAAAGIPSMWNVYVGCGHLDNTLDRVRELGGSVLQTPLTIPTGGRIAVIADPAGAALVLAEEPLASEPIVRDEPGAAVWVECQTRDLAAAREFYEGLFGWKTEDSSDSYLVFSLDGEQIGGLMAMPPMVPDEVPSYWLVYFAADPEAGAVTATELGARVVVPTTEVGGMSFAVLDDPTGAVFGLLST